MTDAKAPPGGLFKELRRRRVLRTLALYILGAWGLMQVADVILPALGLPDEALRYVLFAAVGGFPVVLVFGWFFDITAQGIQRTLPAGEPGATEPPPLRGVDYALLAALCAVLGLVVYGVVDVAEELPFAGAAPGGRQAADPNAPPMIGVLPFAHMGSSEEGEFFASGIHDDLLTRLAKLGALRVISRTSVLQYANTSKTIPEIGGELGADAILEGGVRIAGTQIRINAQLIDARSDEHLWAETFDRELTPDNIFDVQSDIARAISTALRTTLTPGDVAELDLIPTSNMAAYREFHEIMRWRDSVHLDSTNRDYFIDGLQRAIDLDPNFTRPMVELVQTLSLSTYFGKELEELPRIEGLIDRIGQIAPDSADLYTAQSFYVYYVLADFERAQALVRQAQQRAPSDPRLVEIQSWIQRRQGDYEGYLESTRRAVELDPNDAKLHAMYAYRLVILHRYDEAQEMLQGMRELPLVGEFILRQLALRDHADLERYLEELYALMEDKSPRERGMAMPSLWEAHLARRDFAGAEALLAEAPPVNPEELRDHLALPHVLQLSMAALNEDPERGREIAATARRSVGIADLSPDQYPSRPLKTHEHALLAAGENDWDRVSELISRAWNDPERDRADWLHQRHYDCQLLAMAGDPESVACLRSVLEEPSAAIPHLEPLMPYYDKVRGTPAFQALMDEKIAEGVIPAKLIEGLAAYE